MQRSRPSITKPPFGKIARLPLQIRCEINKCIRASEYPAVIAIWLNNEYAVLKVLEAEFDDAPITESDVEEWINGGFLEWMSGTDFSEHVHVISEYASEVRAAGLTTEDLFMTVLAHHAQFIRGMELVSDQVASRRMTLVERLTKSVLSLRRSELAEARKEIELGRLELARECKRAKSVSSGASPALSSPENPASLGNVRPSTTPALKQAESVESGGPAPSSKKLPTPTIKASPEEAVHPVNPVNQVHAVHPVHPSAASPEARASGDPTPAPGAAPSSMRAASAAPSSSAPTDTTSRSQEPAPKPSARTGVPSTASPRNKFGLL